MRVTLLIPAKNEAAAIEQTLDGLPIQTLGAMGLHADVVVLDGGSRDGTGHLARQWGARVIRDDGTGKGRAFRHGLAGLQADFIIMLDADGTYAADAIPRVAAALLRGDADVVMGRRAPLDGAMSGLHRLGNRVLSAEASALFGRRCNDLCTGLWGFRTEVLRALPLRSRGFELEAELFALTCRMGYRTVEVPVDYLPRRGDTKLSAMRDGWRIAACLMRCRFRRMGTAAETPASGEVQA